MEGIPVSFEISPTAKCVMSQSQVVSPRRRRPRHKLFLDPGVPGVSLAAFSAFIILKTNARYWHFRDFALHNENLKWLASLPILMRKSFWW